MWMSIIIQMATGCGCVIYMAAMGHSKASKANTHARLVHTAAARFKERGIDGVGLADLMKELGLTHGGFYKHFASRDALVTEALRLALDDSGQGMRERLGGGGSALEGFVDFISARRIETAARADARWPPLACDAARKGAEVQAQFRKQIAGNIEVLRKALDPACADPDSRAAAISLLSTLYGRIDDGARRGGFRVVAGSAADRPQAGAGSEP